MKRAVLFFSILFIVASIQAQDIFKQHGYNKEMLTLSKGKYKEVFTNDEVVQIGTVLLNTKDGKVIKFLEDGNPELSYKEEYSSRFLTMDPLAEKFPWQSPYVFCSNNPVNRIDPTGMADFWHNGNVIGNDGIDDGLIYAIKTTEKSFGSGDNQVDGAGLSKKDLKATLSFIKDNSGNAEAFQNNGMAYTNSIAIESSKEARQSMINIVSGDNGRGGRSDINNKEYGGSITNGVVTAATPGAVANPQTDASASISLPTGTSTFHSHPSGNIIVGPDSNTFGGSTTTYSFDQHPSTIDVKGAGSNTHYVFGRGNNNVYIYNSSGVQAVIPMKHFVNPKR